jgi:hypothetical protein
LTMPPITLGGVVSALRQRQASAQLTLAERAGTVEAMERNEEDYTSLYHSEGRGGDSTEIHGTIGFARRP